MDYSQLKKELMKFTLSLYNDTHIPRSSVQNIVGEVQDVIKNKYIPFLMQKITDEIKTKKYLEPEQIVCVVLDQYKDLFREFESEKLRFKEYKNNSIYQEPISIDIGECENSDEEQDEQEESLNLPSKRILVKAKATYIPLSNSLKQLLELPGLFYEILKYIEELKKDTNCLTNIMQGKLWNSKYKFEKEKIVLPILLYYDDFEPGNALGSHGGKQELGGVYVILPFLPPHLAVKLDNILVTLLLYTKFRKRSKNSDTFSKIIDEINLLSTQGLVLDLNGTNKTVYFRCVLVTGDNLGVNSICGFAESFSGTQFCRICRASSGECKRMTQEKKDLLRTKDNYDVDLYVERSCGVKEYCAFNKIVDFHITENRSLDLMHDFNEGVVHYTLSRILTCIIIKNKLITLKEFNNRIKKFDYGDNDGVNKPQPIKLKAGKAHNGEKIKNRIKLKQSASEALTLCKCLGLIIGDLIPEDYCYWKIYLILREIASIITSPRISKSHIAVLEHLITKHNELYLEYFGDLKPKMHFLVHVPTIIIDNGPLVHFWSMGSERKNKNLKEMSNASNSHRNTPHTVAIRIQLQQCYRKEQCSNFLSDISLGSIENQEDYDILKYDKSSSLITTYNNVTKCGKKYSIGNIIISGYENDEPKFSKIIKIYGNSYDIRFLVSDVIHDIFNYHYWAYRIISIENEPCHWIKLNEIPAFHGPCLLTILEKTPYISTNYYAG